MGICWRGCPEHRSPGQPLCGRCAQHTSAVQWCALLCAFPALCAAFVLLLVVASADGGALAVDRRLQMVPKLVAV